MIRDRVGNFRFVFWALIAAAIIALLGVLTVYFHVFGSRFTLRLSQDPDDWARFGEYVGGTLGPFYGLLAFGGVLLTLVLQRQQIERISQQSNLDELARLIAGTSHTIDRILGTEPASPELGLKARFDLVDLPISSVFSLLSAIGVRRMFKSHVSPEDQARKAQLDGIVITSIRTESYLLSVELQQIVRCLQEYASAGGSKNIVEIYTDRYKMIVCWLHVAELLTSDIVRTYFDPESYLALSRAADEHEKAES